MQPNAPHAQDKSLTHKITILWVLCYYNVRNYTAHAKLTTTILQKTKTVLVRSGDVRSENWNGAVAFDMTTIHSSIHSNHRRLQEHSFFTTKISVLTDGNFCLALAYAPATCGLRSSLNQRSIVKLTSNGLHTCFGPFAHFHAQVTPEP